MKYELKVGQIYELVTWRKMKVKITKIQTNNERYIDSVIYYKEIGFLKRIINYEYNDSGPDFVKKIAGFTESVIVEL